ncbi:Abi-alpha family protein [Polycyclovorans algicola]|uniref:Abi-alpha family protein n=1 Tax=Polycyclovorans algicola TaxID=616992 RepID=UPI00069381C3|nr:Abi-alpha family protein [Polycyclovorans algicola]
MTDQPSGRKSRSATGRTAVSTETLPARVGEFAGFLGKVAERVAANARATGVGGKAAEQFRKAEQGLLRTLKQRMEDAGRDEEGQASYVSSDGSEVSRTFVIPLLQSPKRILDELLQRSVDQTREQAEEDLYSVMLSELVPDEARILALLSSGEPQALVHIGVGSPIGTPGRLVAENFCSAGRPAQLKLQHCVRLYVSHLMALNLVEEGPEDPALESRYQIMEGEREFRDAVAHARRHTRMSVRIIRRTLVMSEMGRRLWATCTEGQQAAEEPAGFSASPLSAIR